MSVSACAAEASTLRLCNGGSQPAKSLASGHRHIAPMSGEPSTRNPHRNVLAPANFFIRIRVSSSCGVPRLAGLSRSEARKLLGPDLRTLSDEALDALVNQAREFAELIVDAYEASRRRLQELLFPSGIMYDGKEIRTPDPCWSFSLNPPISTNASELASLTGFEPVLPP